MKKPQFTFVRLVVLAALFVTGAFGNTTSFDSTFNGTGYRLQTVGAGSGHGYSLAIQPDGKIVVGGSTRVGTEPDRLALIRLNADGTLDTSFGSGGSAFSPSSLISSFWEAKVLIQSDGKILLGATAWSTQLQRYAFTVLRFTSAGVLDTTFNNTGYATANAPNSLRDVCYGMDLQADGKIVLVGGTLEEQPGDISGNKDIALVRFNANGSLDSTFDGDGIRKIGAVIPDEEGYAVLVLADGKILVGGYETTDRTRFLLTRLNSDGSTDASFGAGGSTIFQVGFEANIVKSMARQTDGKILVAGGGKVTRLTADGVRDMSFGANGVATVPGNDDIRVIGGDKFLLAGNGVRRFMPNGAIDTNFGGGFAIPTPGNNCLTHAVSVQSDGKVLLGGVCVNESDGIEKFAVARFQENRTKRFLDFNGDEVSDISIFRPSNGEWWYLESSTLFYQVVAGQFGAATDILVPAEFSGDGKTDVAVFRPSTGEWFVLRSDGGTFYSFPFGTSGDIPVVGDFDSDQLADAGVFRPSTGEWYIRKTTGGLSITHFGTTGDKPVPSDYDGDFKTDIAVFRPSNGSWWIQKSSDSTFYAFQFGTSNDKPVQGEYTGDNKTDAAFYRPTTGEWFVLRSEDFSYYSIPFGLSDDLPTPGQFTGDGRFDFVVYRPSTNRWHILMNGGFYFYRDFGLAGDVPVPNAFVPFY